MPNPRLLSREDTGQREHIRCGIGHVVSANIVKATYQHIDMDGLPMTPWTVEEYEPATCVVCGLRLYARVNAGCDQCEGQQHDSGTHGARCGACGRALGLR